MIKSNIWESKGFQEAFSKNEKSERIRTGQFGCALVVLLVPFGAILDLFVYPDYVSDFLVLRLLCALIVTVIWIFHRLPLTQRYYQFLGLPVALVPAPVHGGHRQPRVGAGVSVFLALVLNGVEEAAVGARVRRP